ncbi:hypothetical protein EV361DRAFT_954647 [Lentinula raphanica]|nr:hypothetical protein EV361DRAFT_954647 [Lentinula raphanica]
MPHRIADAAHIAPYLNYRTATHHEQPPEDGKQNGTRLRQTKSKKLSKQKGSSRGQELSRNTISNDDSRTSESCQSGRATRHDQSTPSDQQGLNPEIRYSDGTGIPDYPPPSFQEAMSSPPVSVCPSTTTLGIYNHPGRARQSYAPPENFHFSRSQYVNYDSDSDESLEVIEAHGDITQREGISPEGEFIGSRGRALLEDHDPPTPVDTQHKRRHMSLSPLRLFTHRPIAIQERTLSAQSASPYSFHRNTSFFRSTTSLKTVSAGSFFRLPLSAPSSVSLVKSERKATLKGKEKPAEPLDAWEVVPPTSLMSAVESLTSPPSPDSGSPSPVQTHFTFNRNPSDVVFAEPNSRSQCRAESPSRTAHSQNVSSRQRPSLYVSPNPRDPLPVSGILQNPGTSPPSPTSAPKNRIATSSPLSSQSWIARHPNLFSPVVNPLQLALDTPLPLTPVESGGESGERRSQNGGHIYFASDTNEGPPSPSVDTFIGDTVAQSRSFVTTDDSISPGTSRSSSDLIHATDQRSIPQTQRPVPSRLQVPFPSLITTAPAGPMFSEHASVRTPTRRHYPGRPLPKTPQPLPPLETTRNVVDSLYAPSKTESCIGHTFPNGLLIDLDESTESTPTGHSGTFRSELNSPTSTLRLSTYNQPTDSECTLIDMSDGSGSTEETKDAAAANSYHDLSSDLSGLQVPCLEPECSGKLGGRNSYDTTCSKLSEVLSSQALEHSRDWDSSMSPETDNSSLLGLAGLTLLQ